MTDLIGQLHSARLALGLSRSQVADAMGCADVNLGNWERGRHRPRTEHLEAWAEVLGFRFVLEPLQVSDAEAGCDHTPSAALE